MQTKPCPKCAKPVFVRAAQCPHCGANLASGDPEWTGGHGAPPEGGAVPPAIPAPPSEIGTPPPPAPETAAPPPGPSVPPPPGSLGPPPASEPGGSGAVPPPTPDLSPPAGGAPASPPSFGGVKRRCDFCRRGIPTRAKVCPFCARALAAAVEKKPSSRYCPFCLKENEPGLPRCAFCGKAMNPMEIEERVSAVSRTAVEGWKGVPRGRKVLFVNLFLFEVCFLVFFYAFYVEDPFVLFFAKAAGLFFGVAVVIHASYLAYADSKARRERPK